MGKHTPGPWLLAGRTVYALNDKGTNRFSALVQDAHAPAYELNANARLIAAAPELLVALQVARYHVSFSGTDHELELVEAAIAKAKGDQQ